VLVDAPGSERHADASKTLRGFDLIDDIKAELEKKCKGAVSCADILTAAARDASTAVGAPYWSLRYGRKDGTESREDEADRYVPMGGESVTDLIAFFEANGLNVIDLVALSGTYASFISALRFGHIGDPSLLCSQSILPLYIYILMHQELTRSGARRAAW
jgi:peroxidase